MFEPFERRVDVAGGSVVKAFAGSRTSSQSMLANGGWALWFGRQWQMNVIAVSVGKSWLGSVVGMQPRPRVAFQTALATVVPVNVGQTISVAHASCS